MSFDLRNQDDPFRSPYADVDPAQSSPTSQQKQSGFGIASFVVAMLAGVSAFGMLVLAVFVGSAGPEAVDEESPLVILLGLMLFAIVALSLVGSGLGIAGLFQEDRAKAFAIIGLVLNLLLIFALVALVAIGLAVEA